jgi:AcrR family transcriptional regulator
LFPRGLFPRADAAHWAGQLPSLPPGLHEQLRFPLRDAPEDAGEWARIWELAESDALIRAQTAHWYVLPIDHPRAADWRYQQEGQQRDQARRADRRYDEARLAALAEQAGLGKGTVFRRFGTRAGIICALLDADGVLFQHDVMRGPPPLWTRAALCRGWSPTGAPGSPSCSVTPVRSPRDLPRDDRPERTGPRFGRRAHPGSHLRMLLPQARPEIADLDNLAVQLTTALEGLLLLALYMPPPETAKPSDSLADSWQTSSRTSAGTDGRKPRWGWLDKAQPLGQAGVSVNTVKTHVRNLYGKLGTHRRTEAVARARALGLLAPSARLAGGRIVSTG